MTKTISIAIIGAGPAGLTLARLLQIADVDVSLTIFEHDASAKSRKFQGGTLDLHPETGLAAVKKAGLWDDVFKFLRYDGEELVIADKNATELIHMKEQPKTADNKFARPEIDRERLKDILLASIDPSLLRWGKTLHAIDETTGTLSFRDGTTAGPFDLVVGADGAWSKVRPVLTDVRPSYAGVCGFEAHILNPNETHPHVSKMVGRGSYFSASDGRSLMAQRLGDESIKVAVWELKAENYATDTIAAYGPDEAKLKSKILQDFGDGDASIREWVEVATNFRPWNLYELPIGHKWEHKRGYTLVGDAASLMTPFAGEGVNKAMRDCLELAEALEKALKGGDVSGSTDIVDIDAVVAEYEVNMFPRAEFYQSKTMGNKTALFSKAGPAAWMAQNIVSIFKEMGVDVESGLWRLVPVRFAFRFMFGAIQVFGSWRRSIKGLFS